MYSHINQKSINCTNNPIYCIAATTSTLMNEIINIILTHNNKNTSEFDTATIWQYLSYEHDKVDTQHDFIIASVTQVFTAVRRQLW